MASGGKNFMPSAVKKELEKAGLKHVFAGTKIKKDDALKAVRHLKNAGLLKTAKRTDQIYGAAAQAQYQEDLAREEAIRQEHVQTNIRIDLGEELTAEDRGKNLTNYDPKSTLGRYQLSSQTRQSLNQERQKPGSKPTKKDSGLKPNNRKPARPANLDLADLPDMGIDFGN